MCVTLLSSSHHSLRFSAENLPKINQVVDDIDAIASKHKATPGQVALAWLLAQGDDIIPIPGTSKIEVRSALYA